MRFFDTHLHLPRADEGGLDEFLRFVDMEPGLVGGNLILNTAEEVAVVASHAARLPATIVPIPYFDAATRSPEVVSGSGWYKIHPRLHAVDLEAIPMLVEAVAARAPRGVIVHAFPWGSDRRFDDVSLPLVIALARALPETPVLVAHGGGYQAWAFRAHAGGFRNVHFDFSVTLDYYERSDLVSPLKRYLRFSPNCVHFGSDWPSGDVGRQVEELLRLADEIGLGQPALEQLLLQNARSCWPTAFTTHAPQ